jgi:AcrR family transcriptional regulator
MRAAPTRVQRQARTRDELVEAAGRLFGARGFGRTSLDAVADEAGYTKGAVYSNFASKEDLFFAVYERRVERFLAEAERAFGEHADPAAGILRIVGHVEARREHDDGWLAAFLEFWTHVLRHPEHRERFAAIHARAAEPVVGALERFAASRGVELPVDARRLSVVLVAIGTGLGLERLTQPDVVDADLHARMAQLWIDLLSREA